MPTVCPNCAAPISEYPSGEFVDNPDPCDDCERDALEHEFDYEDDNGCDCASCTADRERERESEGSLSSAAASLIAQGLPRNPDILPHWENQARLVSCEWEASFGIGNAAAVLSRMDDPPSWERHGDVTCDGEIVFSCLNLASRAEAKRYGRALEAIRQLRDSQLAGVGSNAGHHIHVSARGADGYLSPNSLVSLVAVYSHCEDLLYRLASAGWRKHRTEESSDYANVMPAIREKTPRNIGNALAGNRYFGLNVSNYLQAITHCHCGAYRYGEWSACECSLSQPTIEFRLWNSAVAPRKVRAYIGLSLALVEYAAQFADGAHAQLAENPFQGTEQVDEDSLQAQWDYLFGLPTLSYRDRSDLEYLRERSPGMGELGGSRVLITAEERGE